MKQLIPSLLIAAFGLPLCASSAEAAPKRILLVTGGCCHDYETQKGILKAGLERRLNVVIDHAHSPDKSTKPNLPILGNADYAKGYDLVIHDECAAGVSDAAIVDAVLKPHRDGLPGVNLHCAMHSYRVSSEFKKPVTAGSPVAVWFDYIGLQSTGHGPRKPIDVVYTSDTPITQGLASWTTLDDELYNNITVYPDTRVLAKGTQNGKEAVVAWSHVYGPAKARVFSTSLGHVNETVADDRYLDLVARGVLWATGQMDEKGQPAPGSTKGNWPGN